MKPIGSILKKACPECGEDLVLKKSKFGLFYGCATWEYSGCKGSHGAHEDTGEPLGIPANKETKEWRMKAHKEFDKFYKIYGYKRKESYKLLQGIMGLNEHDAHIGRFNIDQCKKLINKL